MFTTFRINTDNKNLSEAQIKSQNEPINLTALNAVPSAAECIAALERPEGIKLSHVISAKKYTDEYMNNKERIVSHGRIKADSRSESHKEIMRLTDKKRKIITECYNNIKFGDNNNATMLFIKMFAENPHFKNIWPQFRGINDSSLISSDKLQKHIKVFKNGMNSIIELMNSKNETEFRNLIRRIAQSHAKFGIHKYHIMAMLHEFLAVLKANSVTIIPDVENAWTTFFDVLGNLLSKIKN